MPRKYPLLLQVPRDDMKNHLVVLVKAVDTIKQD